ncbi:MAG: tetratricopeptide repeat protein [Acidobacteriota bacterium]
MPDGSPLRPARSLSLVVLALILAVPGWAQASDSSDHQQQARELAALIEAAEYREAEDRLRRILVNHPEHPLYLSLLGYHHLKVARLPESEMALRQALETRPREPGWLKLLSSALLGQGRRREGLEVLDRAIAITPLASFRVDKAISLRETGELADAERELRAALAREPDHAEAHRVLGELLAERGDHGRAFDHLTRSVELDPTDVEARFRLASSLLALDRDDEAMTTFWSVLRRAPGHAATLQQLGRQLLKSGQAEQGRQMLQAFRELTDLGDRIGNLERVVRDRPRNVGRRLELADLLMEARRPADAVRHYEIARASEPENPSLEAALRQARELATAATQVEAP